jgi:6-phosphogluconolactonase (cycloisomerase 2 family)
MNDRFIERLLRALAAPGSRRPLLAGLATLPLLGGLLGLLELGETDAHGRRKRRKKRHKHGKGRRRKGKGKGKKNGKTCRPQPVSETCAGQCGRVSNNCQQTVDCGPCSCDPACGVCERCTGSTCATCAVCCDTTCCAEDDAVCHATTGACCTPEPQAVTCADTCGTAINNCGVAVECGGCSQDLICCEGTCTEGTWTKQSAIEPTVSPVAARSVAIAPDGLTAWVSDWSRGHVSVWSRSEVSSTSWTHVTTIGSLGTGADEFGAVTGVVLTADLTTLLVSDFNRHRVSVWSRPDAGSSTWSHVTNVGTTSELSYPQGLALSSDGRALLVANSAHIAFFTRESQSSATWTFRSAFGYGGGPGTISGAVGLAISPDGLTAWVSDAGNHRVSVWTRDDSASVTWAYQTQFGTQGSGDGEFDDIVGVAVSPDTRTVWIADRGNGRIAVWKRPDASSTTWTSNAQFGTKGSGPDQFDSIHDLAVTPDEHTVFVADLSNQRVSVWQRACRA